MIINLELYRVFITVAEQGSFTLAAQALGITQSAVSQAIGQLEGLLEARLFARSPRGATLTAQGEVLMGHVGGLLGGVTAAQEYFAQLRGLEGGSLRIGASDTLCRYVLLDKLRRFHTDHPGVALQVTNRTSSETVELLRRGAVDIGFVNLPLEGIGDFDVGDILPLHDCFVCGDRYFDDFSAPVALEALQAYPLIMLERQSASRRNLDAWLRRQGVAITPQIELGSFDLVADFAQGNLGIAAVVEEYITARLAGGGLRIIPLRQTPPPRKAALLTKKGVPIPPAARAFIALLHEAAPPEKP